ncbi:MAG TPA: alkaline phosphatase family protein [Anaerolineales bacterium]|nr:alkaline phosphatase family protein [Anaerolineales bacterium]
MSDITSEILPSLKAHRLPELDLDEQFIYPDYLGGSILNLPASICQWLGVEPLAALPLRPELTIRPPNDIRRVIIVLVDALSLHRLQRWMADGTAPVWDTLADQGQLAALTSVVPSTTSTALTTLWTGRSPAEHGVVGYELWLKEFSVVSNMILHSPITFENDAGSLARAGFNPELFLNLPTLGSHLASHGIRSYALQHRSILRSGLSQMFLKDVEVHGYLTSTELWVNLRHLVESNPTTRQYFWVYTGQIDHYSHYYHPDDERVAAEFSEFSRTFERHFLERLSPALRRHTLILLTADHGMLATHKSGLYDLRNHPGLTRLLHILPTGEHRLMYLFTRPGKAGEIREYYDKTWPGQFVFFDPSEAVARGLYGPGTPHPRLSDRMGDLIAAARRDAYIWWADKENPLIGQHGGLSDEEMIVPLLSVVL